MPYVWTVLYVWGFMAVTVGPFLYWPYTGKGPSGTYTKADRIEPAPPIAEIGPKIDSRLVQVEPIRIAANVIPSSCIKLAAREGAVLPVTEQQKQKAREKVAELARKGDLLAKECQRDMRKT